MRHTGADQFTVSDNVTFRVNSNKVRVHILLLVVITLDSDGRNGWRRVDCNRTGSDELAVLINSRPVTHNIILCYTITKILGDRTARRCWVMRHTGADQFTVSDNVTFRVNSNKVRVHILLLVVITLDSDGRNGWRRVDCNRTGSDELAVLINSRPVTHNIILCYTITKILGDRTARRCWVVRHTGADL